MTNSYTKKIKRFYNNNQEFVISPFNPFREISDFGKNIVQTYTPNLDGKEVLDVGCGHGYLLEYLSNNGAVTYGIDISEVAINKARKISPRTEFKVSDANSLPYGNSQFDYVYCIEVLEHFKNIARALEEMKRVLRPEGYLIISTPNYFNTAGILKKVFEFVGIYPHNTFAPFTNWKRQENENFVTVNNILKKLKNLEYKIIDQYTYNTLHGLLPFLAISWKFYRWTPIRSLRHFVERFRRFPILIKLGMNQIVICQKEKR